MNDLESEMEAAVHRVRQPHLNRLRALGVSGLFIAQLGMTQAPFGVVQAVIRDDGTYQPGGTVPLLVQPVFDATGDLVDIVGWRSADPSRWWLRTGLGWCLGSLSPTWDNRNAVHETPLDWLRAEGVGICVIDWDSDDVRWLGTCDRLIAANETVARLLWGKLTSPAPIPEIEIMEARHAA